ncbi:hypothetical protein [Asanoa iriomotensis]|uniref:DUF4386 family protein n=1 Tax=Asanoa iriomotensis TaxID=234613 RepID=A0ABQ4C234_9ACTN|nr:hypothetical protein [Asanoa iriomotensis]GIF56837.1 hypothetical protein Air01nite_29320 [Asanoa iriomotensis]
MATTVAPTVTPPVTRDLRRFWRWTLAVLAPLPLLALALENVAAPWSLGGGFAETVAGAASATGRAQLALWLSLFFGLAVVPATMAVLWTSRRGAPKLTLAAGILLLLAFSARLPDSDLAAIVAADKGLDPAAVARIDDLVWSYPSVGILSLIFLLGQTVGFVLLGLALWRACVVPAWLAAVLAVSGPAHLFAPGGNAGAAVAWAMTAIGYAGASVALVRTRDDDFDLPPGGVAAARPVARDARTAWRWLLALAAVPLAVFVTVFRYLMPYDDSDPAREAFDKVVAATTYQRTGLAVVAVVVLTGFAGILAVAWHTRRRAPLLTTIGLFLAVPGYTALLAGGTYGDVVAYLVGTRPELDREVAFQLVSGMEASAQFSLLGLVFVAGHLLGTVLIGVALWRSRLAPTWLAIGFTVSQPIHLTSVLTGIRWIDLIGWGLTAAGFAWAAWRLIRQPNDEFDLPPG